MLARPFSAPVPAFLTLQTRLIEQQAALYREHYRYLGRSARQSLWWKLPFSMLAVTLGSVLGSLLAAWI